MSCWRQLILYTLDYFSLPCGLFDSRLEFSQFNSEYGCVCTDLESEFICSIFEFFKYTRFWCTRVVSSVSSEKHTIKHSNSLGSLSAVKIFNEPDHTKQSRTEFKMVMSQSQYCYSIAGLIIGWLGIILNLGYGLYYASHYFIYALFAFGETFILAVSFGVRKLWMIQIVMFQPSQIDNCSDYYSKSL